MYHNPRRYRVAEVPVDVVYDRGCRPSDARHARQGTECARTRPKRGHFAYCKDGARANMPGCNHVGAARCVDYFAPAPGTLRIDSTRRFRLLMPGAATVSDAGIGASSSESVL